MLRSVCAIDSLCQKLSFVWNKWICKKRKMPNHKDCGGCVYNTAGIIMVDCTVDFRSQSLRCLRRESVAVRLLGLWVRIPLRPSISASCECFVLSASASSLVQRSPTECGVSKCDREAQRTGKAMTRNRVESATSKKKLGLCQLHINYI
jgi:hypothetical protein